LISGQSYTSLSDKWAVPFKMDDETGRIEITASEESAKINLNALIQANSTDINPGTLTILKGLGTQFQIPENVWNALADWIDTDDLPRADGAESSYYKTLNPPYSARNGRMTTVNELSLVKGFTSDMVAKLSPFVTVYANQAGSLVAQTVTVNVNTAPKEVLMALDSHISESMAEQIIDERQQTPFKGTGDLSRVDSQLAVSLAGKVIFKGTVFRIKSCGFVKDAVRTVELVVRTTNSKILYWQEY
jgi:general secretion pathway protein K